jgi:UDP-sugar transporter A1/2/3
LILVIQNAATILLLRYVRTASGELFFSTTAIVCQEVMKIFASVCLLFMETYSFNEMCNSINEQIIKNPMDCIKTGIPAFLFTIQTNLVYVAISNLDAAVFQVKNFYISII